MYSNSAIGRPSHAHGRMHIKFDEVMKFVCLRADRQTDRDMLITMLHTLPRSTVSY